MDTIKKNNESCLNCGASDNLKTYKFYYGKTFLSIDNEKAFSAKKEYEGCICDNCIKLKRQWYIFQRNSLIVLLLIVVFLLFHACFSTSTWGSYVFATIIGIFGFAGLIALIISASSKTELGEIMLMDCFNKQDYIDISCINEDDFITETEFLYL